jgi:hypothetical protein
MQHKLFVFAGDAPARSIESIHEAASLPMYSNEFTNIVEVFAYMRLEDKLTIIGIANFNRHILETDSSTYSTVHLFRRIPDTYFLEILSTLKANWHNTYFDCVQSRSSADQAVLDQWNEMRNAAKLPKLRAHHLVIVKQPFPVNIIPDNTTIGDLELFAEMKVTAFEHNSICVLLQERESLAIVGLSKLSSLAQRPVDIAQIHICATDISESHMRQIFNFASDNRIPINVTEKPVLEAKGDNTPIETN